MLDHIFVRVACLGVGVELYCFRNPEIPEFWKKSGVRIPWNPDVACSLAF